MNTRCLQLPRGSTVVALILTGMMAGTPVSAWAQGKKKANPTSKLYVSDVSGEASIDTGEALEDLAKRSVYTAQGTVIETKKPEGEGDRSKYFSTMVYSNGTGSFFDADTRVEVKRFMQEPFTPNRTDMDVEPSISQTQAFISRGTVGLCTSKLVAGSNMNYQTPLGSVNIRGKKIVIEAGPDVTKISMLEGDSTVRGGTSDLGGHSLHAGEQAIIRRGAPGQPNEVQIQRIPSAEVPQLDDKVAMACMAKKTVYFEVREKTYASNDPAVNDLTPGEPGAPGENSPGAGGEITAFNSTTGGASSVTIREIVPVEILPTTLPTQFTVSPSRIETPGR
jgi:hypothetical protein